MSLFQEIVRSEHVLNATFPKLRLEHGIPVELSSAAFTWSRKVWSAAELLGPMSLTATQINDGLNLARHPVFICGVHRSGTTLTRDLLDGHPDLVVFPSEGSYYTNMERQLRSLPSHLQIVFLGKVWLERLANPMNQSPYWTFGRSTETYSPYVDFARYLMAWWSLGDNNDDLWPHIAIILAYASVSGSLSAKMWVDKTPTNERFLGQLLHALPQAKVIHVIREPVATLSSHKKMDSSFNYRRALQDLRFSFSIATNRGGLGDDRFLLVRYEELCEYPRVVIAKMASFLDIEDMEILHVPTVAGMAALPNSIFAGDAAPGQILKAAQHRQSEKLNASEQRLLAAYAGRVADRAGYPMVSVGLFEQICLRLKYQLL